MSDAEVEEFLARHRIARVATVGPDGSPYVVPVGYVLFDDRLAFLTAPGTRTANNIRRDPRVACIVDDGQSYADFRGAELRGRGEVLEDPEAARQVAELFAERVPGEARESALAQLVAIAKERVVVAVKADRVASWDHTRR